MSLFVPRTMVLLSGTVRPSANGIAAVHVCVPSFRMQVDRPVAKPSSSVSNLDARILTPLSLSVVQSNVRENVPPENAITVALLVQMYSERL